ncbi:MAG: Mce-associated rane protein [Mycobacterium sp.]|jgi:Mce-associated membrane protein|nr:Mce-associated rane protein [Mycobacterium sp.]
MTSTTSPSQQRARRRASRAAGPASDGTPEITALRIETTAAAPLKPASKKVGRVRRRAPHRRLVALVSLAFGVVATGAIAAAVAVMVNQQKHADQAQAHTQRYIDTATQTVVDMFSFKQDSINDSVNRFFNSTSGPLRDMMSQSNNIENLKAVFRDTGGSSVATVNGVALESIDSVSNNASVLVSVRVTASDMQGNDRPSRAYRMRVIVHEDDSGQMTTYDLKYPNGGN